MDIHYGHGYVVRDHKQQLQEHATLAVLLHQPLLQVMPQQDLEDGAALLARAVSLLQNKPGAEGAI